MSKFLHAFCRIDIHAAVEVGTGWATDVPVYRCLLCGREAYQPKFGVALIKIPRSVCRKTLRVQKLP
jgi:hypothetical protein